jgi:hypothetical protein
VNTIEQPASARASWPLRITVAGLPPSPNRRMAWQARRRITRPLADAVQLRARALGLPRPLNTLLRAACAVYRQEALLIEPGALARL